MPSNKLTFLLNCSINDYFKNESIFVFHHIHKVGGTSLEDVFSKWFFYKRDFDPYNNFKINNLKNFQGVGGHYGCYDFKIEDKYPEVFKNEKFKVITYVRDPLSRSISHYHHWRNQGYEHFEELSLEDFLLGKIDIPWINRISDNWMADVLSCTEENYKSVLEKYYFIGIFEKLQESTDKLADLFSKKRYKLPHFRNNEKKKNSEVSDEIKSLFKQRNKLDYMIYDYSCELFNKL